MNLSKVSARAGLRSRPPLFLLLPALALGLATCLPAAWLLLRAFEADAAGIAEIVLRARNLYLLGNTLQLVGFVLALGTLIALPAAWAVTRSDLRHPGLVSFLMVLPLAVPGYVMAYAIIGLSGYQGFLRQWFGLTLPPLRGLWGAGLALSLYTFPYIFLALRAAFLGMDPRLEETARSLGRGPFATFRHVTLPQLWPALVSSWLVVGLYVIGDFGAIALMRYEVFSYAIYTQYSSAFDRTYAAWLALLLLAITLLAVQIQASVTRNRRLAASARGARRQARPVRLGRWRWGLRGFLGLVVLASLGLPILVLLHWMRLGLPEMDVVALLRAMLNTVLIAAPAALLALLMALPVVLLDLRWPGPLPRVIARLAWLGYATPSLALGLALAFMSLRIAPMLYQSWALLILACVISFVALALGPARLALLQIGAGQEEAARALGAGPVQAFRRVVLPRLRRPLIASGILIFVMVVKELPLTWMLAPTGVRTLSTSVFAHTSEGMMATAAPFALVIILFSACFVGLILKHETAKLSAAAEGNTR